MKKNRVYKRQAVDKVVVMDLHGTNHYYHVFQYPSFCYFSSFGKCGDYPQEMLSVENIRYKDNAIWVLDANKSELTRLEYSLGDLLLSDEVVTLNKSLLWSFDSTVYDDSTLIIPDYFGDHRSCWVNRKGELIRKSGVIPIVHDDALQNARPVFVQAWRGFIDYNSNNGILAIATQLGKVLEIYHLKDTTRVVCIGPNGEPQFKIADGYCTPADIMEFSHIQVTDSAIYTVIHRQEIAQKNGHPPDGGGNICIQLER